MVYNVIPLSGNQILETLLRDRGQGTFLPQNPMMPVKLSPRSHLRSTNFHHVIDTNVKIRHITLLIGSLAMVCGTGNKTCILPLLFVGCPLHNII